MSAAMIAAVRSRLAAAFPDARDAGGDPHPQPETALPFFAVAATYGDAERASMGSRAHWRTAELAVAFWTARPAADAAAPSSAEAALQTVAATVLTAVMAEPADLGGDVWDIAPGSTSIEHDGAAARVSRVDVTFSVRLLDGAA